MRQFNVHLVNHSRFGFLLDTEEEMEERDEDEKEEREREKSIVDRNGRRKKRVKRFNDTVVLSSFPRYMTKGILSKETIVIHQ